MKALRKTLLVVAILLGVGAAAAIWIRSRFGSPGLPFPRLVTLEDPRVPAVTLVRVATLPEPPGNVAVASSGRIFLTYHPEARPAFKVVELIGGNPVPFPNKELNRDAFKTPFNLRIDAQDRLWTIDHGLHGLLGARLMAFQLRASPHESEATPVFDLEIPRSIAGFGSFLQDMQIAPDGRTVYISDTGVLSGRPSLIIVDVATRTARRLLEAHPALMSEGFELKARGEKEMRFLGGLFAMRPGFDPIVLDRAGEWLYVGAMSGRWLSRARTRDLLDANLTSVELAARVERYAEKPQCDGLTIANDGTIYLTAVERGAIYTLDPDRHLALLVQHPELRWPDGMSFGPDGDIYLADSALQDVMFASRIKVAAAGPFTLWRFASGKTGRPGQ